SVAVEVKDGEVYVGGAKIIASVKAGNGIVHVVDKVMLPPAEE
ncbi:MAG: fasciclin domain-containing protein, partial [Eudoraea sp.]|nr:fasciclin domain-containing protein [Eudoraea sp.]